MSVLYGRFDPITGARITSVLSHKMDQLWQDEDPATGPHPASEWPTPWKRCSPAPDSDDDGRSQGTRQLLIAEYDAITKKLRKALLPDGTPSPRRSPARRLAPGA